MPAFAITIHKSQGLSLQTAIVDAGPTTFGPGMIYVGLSRITTLHGLHLVDLDRTKIVSDNKAITEYNRLRQLYTPHLGDIGAEGGSQNINQHVVRDHDGDIGAAGDTSQDICEHAVTNHDDGDIGVAENTSPDICDHAVTDHDGDIGAAGDTSPDICQHTVTNHDDDDESSATASSQHAGINSTFTFQSCEIESLTQFHQQQICNRLNLQLFNRMPRCMTTSHSEITRHLKNAIYKQTHTYTDIYITYQWI